jgi:hypothetical protein
MENATDVMLKLLDSAKGIPAKYLLFDSWFAFPKTIANILKRKLDVICMLKISSKIHYFYEGEWMNLKSIYSRVKLPCKSNIKGSVLVGLRESKKNPEIIWVRIVFVNDRHSKNWLAVLSTDIKITDEEIIRIYGKRWDIEVFFKMTKQYLALGKEFQGRSYNMMIAHTTIVMMRYSMLSLESRNSTDMRTVGDLFYYCCDEAQDINFSRSLFMVLDLLKKVLSENPLISEDLMNQLLDSFISSLPSLLKEKLRSCA